MAHKRKVEKQAFDAAEAAENREFGGLIAELSLEKTKRENDKMFKWIDKRKAAFDSSDSNKPAAKKNVFAKAAPAKVVIKAPVKKAASSSDYSNSDESEGTSSDDSDSDYSKKLTSDKVLPDKVPKRSK